MMPPPREVPAKKQKTTVDDPMNTVPWGMHVGGPWQLAKAARDAQASVVVFDGVDDTPAVVLPIRPTAAPAPTDAGIAAGLTKDTGRLVVLLPIKLALDKVSGF
jgi:hypothetical protein